MSTAVNNKTQEPFYIINTEHAENTSSQFRIRNGT